MGRGVPLQHSGFDSLAHGGFARCLRSRTVCFGGIREGWLDLALHSRRADMRLGFRLRRWGLLPFLAGGGLLEADVDHGFCRGGGNLFRRLFALRADGGRLGEDVVESGTVAGLTAAGAATIARHGLSGTRVCGGYSKQALVQAGHHLSFFSSASMASIRFLFWDR